MRDWLLAPLANRRLLGGAPLRGPTPWLIAIMSFSLLVIAAAGLALANSAGLVAQASESRYSVQVPGGSRDLPAALRAVRSAPGVEKATAVPEQEMRALLERWLGAAASSSDLPVPALIDVELSGAADPQSLERNVAAAAPGATGTAHSESLGPLLDSLRALQLVALGLVLLLAGAAAAAVVLAARGALDTHRFTIEVMHGIGATDIQVTNLFQRKIAIEALAGSLGGAFAAAVVLLVLAASARFAGDFAAGPLLGWGDLLLLALLPLALTLLATWVARITVLAALRRSL